MYRCGMCVSADMDVQMYRVASVQMNRCADVKIYKRGGVVVYRLSSIQMNGCAGVQIYRLATTQMCGVHM